MATVGAAATESEGAPQAFPADADVDAFAAEVDDALAGLREAVDKAGLRRDAYGTIIEAQARTLALMPGFLRRMARLAERGHEPLDPAALVRLEKSAASGAARYAGELARAHSLRTFLIAGGVYLASLVVVAVVSNHWGHVDERIGFQETEDQIKGAFANGPATAEAWAVLVSNNDAALAMKRCRGEDTWKDSPTGRQVCRMVFFIEPPK